MKLYENDILFLLKKTKLPLKNLLNLIEEERDFNLVIDSISSNLTPEEFGFLSKLSDKLRVKIVLYYFSKDKNYDIDEKSLISNIISNNYDFFYKENYKIKNGQKKEIKQLLICIKNNKINCPHFDSIKLNFIENGYKKLGFHLKDWVNIINKSKELILNI